MASDQFRNYETKQYTIHVIDATHIHLFIKLKNHYFECDSRLCVQFCNYESAINGQHNYCCYLMLCLININFKIDSDGCFVSIWKLILFSHLTEIVFRCSNAITLPMGPYCIRLHTLIIHLWNFQKFIELNSGTTKQYGHLLYFFLTVLRLIINYVQYEKCWIRIVLKRN